LALEDRPSPGERKSHERFDLEEVRSRASVIIQAEKFGTSLVESLSVHSESTRIKRMQRAEEPAQTAGTKVLFPTVIFILPAMFVVILRAAIMHMIEILAGTGFR
jgi:tight adherence protein C